MSAVNNQFLGLPTVLQKKIMQDLPLKDLVRQSQVSKHFKTLADDDHAWINVAKQFKITQQGSLKKEVISAVGKMIKEIISEIWMNFGEHAKPEPPLTFHKAFSILKDSLQTDKTGMYRYISEAPLARSLIEFAENGDLKGKAFAQILLKAGARTDSQHLIWLIKACERDITIFKAYLNGKKAGKGEVDLAIDCNSPKLLKFICAEYAQFTTQNVATVIFNLLIPENEVEKQKTEEIWQILLQQHTDRTKLEAVLKYFRGTKIPDYCSYMFKENLKKEIISKLN